MATMIEKMARAILATEADGQHAQARAALTVMLEPTVAMLAAMKVENEGVTNTTEDWDECHRRMLSAAIQAALDENPA